MKKILVIGNGFDIDAGLRTSYIDFLRLCNFIGGFDSTEKLYRFLENSSGLLASNEKYNFSKSTINKLRNFFNPYKINISYSSQMYIQQQFFFKFCKSNFFIQFINEKNIKKIESWDDVEGAIETIISIVWQNGDDLENLYDLAIDDHPSLTIEENYLGRNLDLISGLSLQFQNKHVIFEAVKTSLLSQLNELSIGFCMYLQFFLNTTFRKNQLINQLNFDYVINFNYTNTFNRLYNRETLVHYIHGSLPRIIEIEKSKIVFGVSSSPDVLSYKNNCFIEFQKYYQRITKLTGNKYKEWLIQPYIALFFGHSLSVNDSEFIIDLVNDKNSNIIILYYDIDALNRIVKNLDVILGKDTLITLTGTAKLRFIISNNHEKITETFNEIELGTLFSN